MQLEEVRAFLTQVSWGCPQDRWARESLPVPSSIYLQVKTDGTIEAVTTDSYILIHRSMKVSPAPKPCGWSLFSAHELKQAMKWFRKNDEAEITFEESGVTIKSDRATIVIPSTEGDFPNYQKLKPDPTKAEPTSKVALNAELARRIQSAFADSPLALTFTGDMKPIYITPAEHILGAVDHADQWALLMPIRMPR